MSAINVFLRRDRAIMMTDAAMYPADGRIAYFGMKAIAIPNLKAVISVRGAQKAAAILAMEMSMLYRDFDHMAQSAGGDIDTWFYDNVVALADEVQQDIQIVVAGWSDREDRPAGFYYDSTGDDGFHAMDIADDVIAPDIDEIEEARLHQLGCEPGVDYQNVGFDPIRHGIPLMEAQRRMKHIMPGIADGEPLSIVGGHILLSEVSREGVSQKIIHKWSDLPGQVINPDPFTAAAPIGMSRQQRRALARQRAV